MSKLKTRRTKNQKGFGILLLISLILIIIFFVFKSKNITQEDTTNEIKNIDSSFKLAKSECGVLTDVQYCGDYELCTCQDDGKICNIGVDEKLLNLLNFKDFISIDCPPPLETLSKPDLQKQIGKKICITNYHQKSGQDIFSYYCSSLTKIQDGASTKIDSPINNKLIGLNINGDILQYSETLLCYPEGKYPFYCRNVYRMPDSYSYNFPEVYLTIIQTTQDCTSYLRDTFLPPKYSKEITKGITIYTRTDGPEWHICDPIDTNVFVTFNSKSSLNSYLSISG